ncbi:uracil-DNA glycosylase [Metarhizobium album]|uniref:Type-4 uracil-DNA glycosylase n=2 Tax=Metarhizobium album TaxID=2182425 RepID=A0A2U2DU29_9HYPH|nr:UdgX family uracil-DNA binding protein [Rhizobium album]PWE56812.1 uracil-DNA glycosylase [Rhizobium album]
MRTRDTDSRVLASGIAYQEPHSHTSSLKRMRDEAQACERCELYRHATHVVFGEGTKAASIVLVGEQPGDKEDLAARPFVGPAGRLLNECLSEAGIDRADCYVTNAVKHFKFEQRGKRRLHSKPNAGEVRACAWWLGGELDIVKPKLVVALGATALLALLGRSVGLMKQRGKLLETPAGHPVLVTIHPSFLLRLRAQGDIEAERRLFVQDLTKAVPFLKQTSAQH